MGSFKARGRSVSLKPYGRSWLYAAGVMPARLGGGREMVCSMDMGVPVPVVNIRVMRMLVRHR